MIRYNEEKKANEICLVEVFKSIDGEGFHSGQATVFVRTFGCNLRCPWCDTKESWTEENFKKLYPNESLLWITADELVAKVEDLEKDFIHKSICLTGGEPLLPENTEFVTELADKLIALHYAVNIETNGGVDYKYWKDRYTKVTIIDPYGNREGL